MQINDLVSQFHNSLKTGTEMKAGTKGIEQTSQTLQSLKPGQIFEGSITSVKGDQVTISLSSGQSIQARLDQGVSISQGQSVFFEVKSNADNTIQIRALDRVVSNNPTLLTALDAAGLPATERNLTMVNSMMQEQMPIDAKSLQFMAQTLHMNPATSADSIVMMQKLNIPITGEMIEQFENYKANEGAILKAVDDLVNTMAQTMADSDISTEDAISFQKNLVGLLQLGEEETVLSTESMQNAEHSENVQNTGNAELAQNSQGAGNTQIDENVQNTGNAKNAESVQPAGNAQNAENLEKIGTQNTEDLQNIGAKTVEVQNPSVSNREGVLTDAKQMVSPTEASVERDILVVNQEQTEVLSKSEQAELQELLKQMPQIRESLLDVFSNGTIKPDVSVKEFLNQLTSALQAQPNIDRDLLLKLFDSSPYKTLLKNLMQESWTIKPESLSEENKIQNLYEKLEVHMKQLEEAAKQLTGNENNAFSKVAHNVQSNIEFINQVNHAFTYVQIPLQFANQNATGDLYVYSNKRGKGEESDELSAFLHFDLEHLGSTDISVKLKNKNVDTQFFMDDDRSFQLIQDHIEILQKRLESKGFHATITVSYDQEPVNLISSFLEKEVAMGNGDNVIQRYSFDVKA
ncbi:MAG: flagellar hook-length control protein FliK [Lachnospiraceae bacterium]|nr:flagellar hook-length control protein FliK [Lachnospiraceae bacterium]